MQNESLNVVSCTLCRHCTLECPKGIDNLKEKKNIVLFGYGEIGQHALNLLKIHGIKIKWMSDNNAKLWGKEFDGVKLVSPCDLIGKDVSILITSGNYHMEIDEQLFKMGISAINTKLNIQRTRNEYEVLRNWMYKKIHSKSIARYLKENSYKNIAIYGIGEIGQLFLWEMQQAEVAVKYAIVENLEYPFAGIPILFPADDLPDVDAIVVCEPFVFKEIRRNLSQKVQMPILSIDKLVYEA